MTLSLTPAQWRAVVAVFVVCILVNAALYFTVSFTRLHEDNQFLNNFGNDLESDIERTARPPLQVPSWLRDINTSALLHTSNETLSAAAISGATHFSHEESSVRSASVSFRSEVTTMAAKGKGTEDFDALRVFQLFQNCKQENGDLLIDCYNDAYEELCKLFKLFGGVFTFVTSDVVEKIGILRDYRKSKVGEEYRTIQNMVKYEVDNNLTIQKHKASGCRTLLRLHRALDFIDALMVKIRDTDEKSKFSHEAMAAYDVTLAKFHPWLVRKGVHLAMYALPNRSQLLVKMKVEDTPEGMAQINKLIEQLQVIYNITQKEYADNSLLDLP